MQTEMTDWARIEREAREQAMAELDRLEATPLEIGALIAWTERGYAGTMDGLSIVHRVAQVDDKPETFCGEAIPAPIRRLTLTPGWIRTQARCKWCEQGYAQSAQAGAA